MAGKDSGIWVLKGAVVGRDLAPAAASMRTHVEKKGGFTDGLGSTVVDFLGGQGYDTSRLGFTTWSVLQSRPGCAEQRPHTDYDVEDPGFQAAMAAGSPPFGVLTALEPGTHLVTYGLRGSATREDRQDVCLEPGDVLVFRGDVVHAGAAYDSDNVRLHAYLDSNMVERRGNSTWDGF